MTVPTQVRLPLSFSTIEGLPLERGTDIGRPRPSY